MSNKTQVSENLKLSAKLAKYIVKHPETPEDQSGKTSYVVFSATDKKLNAANSKLIESLKKEGKNVVKVQQTNKKKDPWSFTSL